MDAASQTEAVLENAACQTELQDQVDSVFEDRVAPLPQGFTSAKACGPHPGRHDHASSENAARNAGICIGTEREKIAGLQTTPLELQHAVKGMSSDSLGECQNGATVGNDRA